MRARLRSDYYAQVDNGDPFAPPAIQLNLLTDDRDRVLARRALRDALELLRSPSLGHEVVAVRDRNGVELGRDLTEAKS